MVQYPVIHTERLLIRELALDDAAVVHKHFSDPEVTRFMDIEPCRSDKEAEEIIKFHINDTGCRYGLFSKKDGNLVGTCGFHCWVNDEPARAEIGFDLSKAYWGQGLMQEALSEVIKVGFDIMKLDFIEATVDTNNVRSQKLLEKMNFIRQEELRDNLYYYILQFPSRKSYL
ncbi:GNAT family N-acetyltransferase [Paenibacillus sediminis]|uniref:Ribosomal-protein-alanine N-acetyltransferase n=1 Tax=Paenibacillus sediminis TaxID=664909 RepID=A0ABS4H1T9_9BACL|nr:GNAT family N-acetyltransferase [Paenibacillus sediminis]MBP1936495.1 ribosomal-protein-alanine N-acetyltransferase [Paenibacillus sediminis]